MISCRGEKIVAFGRVDGVGNSLQFLELSNSSFDSIKYIGMDILQNIGCIGQQIINKYREVVHDTLVQIFNTPYKFCDEKIHDAEQTRDKSKDIRSCVRN